MPEFKDLMSGKWQSWWAFQFWIAQAFQIMSIFGYAGFDAFSAIGAQGKAANAMAIIATLSFFLFPIFYFMTGCKMSQKISLVVGTCAFLVQMSLTSQKAWLQRDLWQFGIGWAGFVNAVLAAVYLFFDKSGEEKPEAGLSSVMACSAFTFSFIASYGFSAWSAVWTAVGGSTKMEAALIFDILGTAFAGFAVLFSFYNCAKGKMVNSGLAALCLFVGACIWSSEFASSTAVNDNAFAFHWLAAIASIATVALGFMKK